MNFGAMQCRQHSLCEHRDTIGHPQEVWPCEHNQLGFYGGDTNLRRYVGNNPTDATDPTGLEEESPPEVQQWRQYRSQVDELERQLFVLKDYIKKLEERDKEAEKRGDLRFKEEDRPKLAKAYTKSADLVYSRKNLMKKMLELSGGGMAYLSLHGTESEQRWAGVNYYSLPGKQKVVYERAMTPGSAPVPTRDPAPMPVRQASAGSKVGKKTTKYGIMSWRIEPAEGGAHVIIHFTPDTSVTGPVVFIQVVTKSVRELPKGKEQAVHTEGGEAYWRQFETDAQKGDNLDHIKGETDPYYNAVRGKKGQWINDFRGRIGWGGGTPIYASMVDDPSVKKMSWFRAGFTGTMEFETAAFDLTHQEILGVLTWGFTTNNLTGTMLSAKYSDTPSAEFRKLVEKANSVDAMQEKVEAPKAGGVSSISALPELRR